jgi:hypothetical protein
VRNALTVLKSRGVAHRRTGVRWGRGGDELLVRLRPGEQLGVGLARRRLLHRTWYRASSTASAHHRLAYKSIPGDEAIILGRVVPALRRVE